jgi:hypothetical protein
MKATTRVITFIAMLVKATLVTTLIYGVIMIAMTVIEGNYFLSI